jgi:hypothetical protein
MKNKLSASLLTLLATSVFPSQAGTVSYDLASQWANNSNPNGAFSFKQGNSLLPYQSSFAALGALALPGLTNGYAPGDVPGNFLPVIGQASGNGESANDYIAGDVVFHTVDSLNGNPAAGQFNIDWTAPSSGTITISGDIWYGQSSVTRSNDFSLELVRGGLVIQTIEAGTISPTSALGSGRNNQDPLSSGGSIAVSSGDIIELVAERSAGQVAGSADALNLTITETSAPEPAAWGFACIGIATLGLLRNRLRSAGQR